MQCLNNLLLNTDSYKASHWLQYPPGTDATFFYVESRGGLYDRTLFYGLQAILKEYLAKPITHADVDEARDVYKDPVTDKGKQSKRGRMTLLRHRELGTFQTAPVPPEANSLADLVKPLDYDDAMVTVRENGHLVHDWTFAEVRSRADATRL